VSDDGRTATVAPSVDGLDPATSARAAAAWAVAHATSMGISIVSADGRTWRDHAWHDDAAAPPAGQVSITVG
jgi:hypothetical protein